MDSLQGFLKLSGAESALVADYGGNLIVACGPAGGDSSLHTMGALAAGAFSATRELAALVHEPGFHTMIHQGERHSMFLQGIGREFIILVVFDPKTTVGLVKLYTGKLVQEMEPFLRQAALQPISSGGPSFEVSVGGVFDHRLAKE
jgi:predicted regulator of Ras-like GTPase activity (Roadblock/LC7/MglB family)